MVLYKKINNLWFLKYTVEYVSIKGVAYILKILSINHIKIIPDTTMELENFINGSEIIINEVSNK